MKFFQKLLVIFVSLLFFVPIFAQSVNLSESFAAGDSDAVIYYPVGWTLNENSLTYYQLVEVEFDLSCGQQPRGVMMSIFVHPKSEIHLSDYSLMSVFDALASPPSGATFEPYEVENTALPMMRGDAMMPRNVNSRQLLWMYLRNSGSISAS